jgi:lipopolysaccharide transport system ATP-binding protein
MRLRVGMTTLTRLVTSYRIGWRRAADRPPQKNVSRSIPAYLSDGKTRHPSQRVSNSSVSIVNARFDFEALVACAAVRAALQLEDVWKAYPRWDAGTRTLRGMATRRVALLARRGGKRWALRDVSVKVDPGGSLGLIGQNGAGKSTCLRLAAGLARPTRGIVAKPDNVVAVLNLGTVFDFDLTGRENAMTTAVVNGMRRSTARRAIREALEFAELEEYADAPLRTYSEGMKLRLAFGVIGQLRPEALIVDEVLAVGDLRFQAKCLERIRELRESGMSLVLASHDLDQVAAECEQAVWLQGGSVRAYGEAPAVVESYRSAMLTATIDRTPAAARGGGGLELRRNRYGSQEVTIESVALAHADGSPADEIVSGAPLAVSLELHDAAGPVRDAIVAIAIRRASDGVVCLDSNTENDGISLGIIEEPTVVTIAYERVDLLPGAYDVEVGVYASDWEYAYDAHFDAYPLRVVGAQEAKGVFRVVHRWSVATSQR